MKTNKSWLMVRLVLILVMVVVALSSKAQSAELAAKVLEVVDGNTLLVKGDDNESYTLLLNGVDSPELEQTFGQEAHAFLTKLVLKKNVTVRWQGKDRWGNRLAVVFLKGEVDVRIELLKAGLAWTAERNPEPALENVRKEAELSGKGLWATADPMAPWIFRRQQSMMQVKGS